MIDFKTKLVIRILLFVAKLLAPSETVAKDIQDLATHIAYAKAE